MADFNSVEGIPWRPEVVSAAVLELLADERLGVLVVARHGGAIVAYGVATFGYDLEFAGRDAFVTELFVEDSVRGRGVGSRILESLVGLVGDAGASAVHLMVRPENGPARRLYGRCGFDETRQIVMTRRLPASG